MTGRTRGELAELDGLVLGHVTRYPGLTSYEIARALRLSTPGGNAGRSRVLAGLLRLLFAGSVAFDRVRWAAPGGYKITWHSTKNGSERKSSMVTDEVARALRAVFVSPSEADRNFEPANIVDGLFAIARSIDGLSEALIGRGAPGHDSIARAMRDRTD